MAKKGFVGDIEKLTIENNDFQHVVYTGPNEQLVLMSIPPGEEIGEEVHKLDQFLRVEKGSGQAVLDGVKHEIKKNFAILVPAGAKHNVINTGSEPLKLYTVYGPPNHKDKTVHHTKKDAEASEEHYDGKPTE